MVQIVISQTYAIYLHKLIVKKDVQSFIIIKGDTLPQ
jgi:hypothetical protein